MKAFVCNEFGLNNSLIFLKERGIASPSFFVALRFLFIYDDNLYASTTSDSPASTMRDLVAATTTC